LKQAYPQATQLEHAIGPLAPGVGQKRPRVREAAQRHPQRQTRTGILLWVRVSLPRTRAETPLCP
jgi:hypothetical protein